MAIGSATQVTDIKYVREAPSGTYLTLQAPDGRVTEVPKEIEQALRDSGYTDPAKPRVRK